MFNAISNMIIKAADNMNRGVENATQAGEGNNGQNYQSNAADNFADKASQVGQDAAQKIAESQKKDEPQSNSVVPNPTDILNQQPDDVSQKGLSSDERLKRIFGESAPIDCFAKIDAIQFTYNDKAKEVHPDEENGVDNDPHFGVKAQDLEKNPLTASAVSKDADGYLQVNPGELTMANTAVISEICKHLKVIEKILGVKVE